LHADEEFMGEVGTHSILDVQRVVHTTDAPVPVTGDGYNTLRPLAPDRITHHFGTDRPTVREYEEKIAEAHRADSVKKTLLDECQMRWTGLFVVLHTEDQPTHVGFFGYSGD
jgi:hypothetical protein